MAVDAPTWMAGKGVCGNCMTIHTSPTVQFCVECCGWLRFRRERGQGHIEWLSYAIEAHQTEQEKDACLQKVSEALKGTANIALLAVDGKTGKSVVLCRRAGRDIRLSWKAEGEPRAHPRRWETIREADWEVFEEIAGRLVPRSKLPSRSSCLDSDSHEI
jgi:hypothetical protein